MDQVMGQVDAAAARLLLQTAQRYTSGEVGGRLGCGGLRCGVDADVAVGDPPVAFDEDAAPHDDDVDLSVNERFATAALASDHPAPAHAPLGASNALLFLAATSLAGSPRPGSATRAAEGAHDPRAEDAAAPRDGKHGERAWRMKGHMHDKGMRWRRAGEASIFLDWKWGRSATASGAEMPHCRGHCCFLAYSFIRHVSFAGKAI